MPHPPPPFTFPERHDIEQNGRRGDTVLPARPAVVTPDMLPKIREAAQ
jgi:hypothetical protein